jgi:hypothetical protein
MQRHHQTRALATLDMAQLRLRLIKVSDSEHTDPMGAFNTTNQRRYIVLTNKVKPNEHRSAVSDADTTGCY